MAFKIAPCKACCRSYPHEKSGTVASQQCLPQRDALATRTRNLGSNPMVFDRFKFMILSNELFLVETNLIDTTNGIKNN